MEPTSIAKRSAINFGVFAVCAFILWLWAALIDWLAQSVGLTDPGHLTRVATSIARSSTLEAIVSIWLLTASIAIAFPALWRPLSATTMLMFDIGYGILGALAGFGLAIGLFDSTWTIVIAALAYSAALAIGYALVRRFLPLSDVSSYGKARWILAAVLLIASPVILLWG